MTGTLPKRPVPRSLQSRLVTINTALFGIGALIYLIEAVLVVTLNLRATYVWLPLMFALFLVIAASTVVTFLGVFLAFRNSFFADQPQRVLTKLQRLFTLSCVSFIPLLALMAFLNIVGSVLKSF